MFSPSTFELQTKRLSEYSVLHRILNRTTARRRCSCRAMLKRLRELQLVLGSSFGYLYTRKGAAEFPGPRLNVPSEGQ